MMEYEEFEKFLNRVNILNNVIDSTIEMIGILAATVVVSVALKFSGVV